MDTTKLQAMSAAEVVWLAVNLSGKRRRAIEEALDLIPGQIDRWSSRKDHHTPSLAVLPELIEATATDRDISNHVLILWLLARVAGCNLHHEHRTLEPCELVSQLARLSVEFGRVALATQDAIHDKAITRPEAMRIKNAAADVISRCQGIMHGVEPYI